MQAVSSVGVGVGNGNPRLSLPAIRVRTSSYSRRRINLPSCPMASSGSESGTVTTAPKWAQKTITIPPLKRGCHLITSKILKEIDQDLSTFHCGLAHLFLQHTSASLTINENYDSDVRHDTETFLNRVVPEGINAPWKHTLEGPDDMPAHIKSSMFGCALTVPITNGKLNMGTWQGIWLCEHRDYATPRNIVVTLNGIERTEVAAVKLLREKGAAYTCSSACNPLELVNASNVGVDVKPAKHGLAFPNGGRLSIPARHLVSDSTTAVLFIHLESFS